MSYILLLLCGAIFANGIPHFINGISGRYFKFPPFQKYFSKIPSSLFNVIWGILNFIIALGLYVMAKKDPLEINPKLTCLFAGFCFSSIGLSIYFKD